MSGETKVDDIDVSSVESDQHLTFVLSEEEFAIPVITIKEIIEYGHLTNVPMVPEFIHGVVNLRGNVVPVLSLASKFGLENKEINKRTCIIILDAKVEDEVVVMGVIVDKVLQVIEIPEADIEPPPSLGATIRTDFIKGMGKIDDNFIVILDILRVLSAEEIALMSDMNKEEV
ncbi:MAG: chemotaxis protein CheW [Gammaproteobacteria bacterium]|nr:chemotaxis protein CheW [Gammaproteobacteria bacterium]